MLIKNLQLFESLLSPKKQRLHWYRGVDLEDDLDEKELTKEDIGINPTTIYGDETPAQWFTTDIQYQKSFTSYGIVGEVKFYKNIDLFNIFDSQDILRLQHFCQSTGEELPDFEDIKEKQGKSYKFKPMAWEELEEYAGLIKDQGFDGIILNEGLFTIELFYNKFDIIKIYNPKEAEQEANKQRFGKESPDNSRKRLIRHKQLKKINTGSYK